VKTTAGAAWSRAVEGQKVVSVSLIPVLPRRDVVLLLIVEIAEVA